MDFFAFLLLFSASNPICEYSFTAEDVYVCSMEINNPNGQDNFTSIEGSHLGDYESYLVRELHVKTTRSQNIPRILCDEFNYLLMFEMRGMHIESISDVSA